MTVPRPQTTILIADDHPMVLRGLVDLIREIPDMQVVCTCADGLSAFISIRQLCPDIAIVDRKMPEIDGIKLLKGAKAVGVPTRIVILTAEINDADVAGAISAGVDGLLLKHATSDELIDCLRKVASGGYWLPPDLVEPALGRETMRHDKARQLFGPLTEREREVVALACRSLSNKEISRELEIAEGTVKIDLNNIYSKLAVSSRVALLSVARDFLDELPGTN